MAFLKLEINITKYEDELEFLIKMIHKLLQGIVPLKYIILKGVKYQKKIYFELI